MFMVVSKRSVHKGSPLIHIDMEPHLKAPILQKGLLWLSICNNMANQCTGCGAEKHFNNNKCYTCGDSYCSNCVKETKNKRANSWLLGGFEMYMFSRRSKFQCNNCIQAKDKKGNIIAFIVAGIIVSGIIGFMLYNRDIYF